MGIGAIRRHDAGVTGGVGVADADGFTDADADGGVGDAPGDSDDRAQLASDSIAISAMFPTTIRNMPKPLEPAERIATASFVGLSGAWHPRLGRNGAVRPASQVTNGYSM
jgi:hypothetical protein